MLVYGDPQFSEPLAQSYNHLRTQITRTRPVLEDLRVLLIHSGQVEQAVEDSYPPLPDSLRARIRALTDLAARAFVAAWAGAGALAAACVQQLRRASLPSPEEFPGASVTIKVPEGYEFYSLYPEQYILAARAWARQQAAPSHTQVLVIGIRSIGTSLSAVVQAALELEHWRPQRFTLRPGGHPFDRAAQLPELHLARNVPALIVDEGPGLSGSTMHSVARALQSAGITRLSLLPGHDRLPGNGANAATRTFWETTPRFYTPWEQLSWNGSSLADCFSAACEDPVVSIIDLTGGQWREEAFESEADWPAVVPVLERTKYLCRHQKSGLLLWKFTGLCSRLGPAVTIPISLNPWQLPVIAHTNGFSATRWVEGERLHPADAAHPEILSTLAAYLQASAGPVLDAACLQNGTNRLTQMLVQNTREALGEAAACVATDLARSLTLKSPVPAYTDGHLGPWEWVRDRQGRLWKTDATGHVVDHTFIGEQSLAWDLAGLVIEWDLSPAASATVLDRLTAGHFHLSLPDWTFYHAAYAAFRLGVCTLFAPGAEPEEQHRLTQRADFYRMKLQQHLAPFAVASRRPASRVKA